MSSERERFEAWAKQNGFPYYWHKGEGFMFSELSWKVWCAALSAPAVPEWQPIETAPKDMLPHLFRVNGVAVEAFRDATWQLLVLNERREWRAMRGKPTHWMPLPLPPAAPSAKEPG